MYHDMGNLNCTFFTRKSGYDRRRNLDIVSKAIQSVSNLINVRVNERDDIVVNPGLDPKEDRKVLRKLLSLYMIYFVIKIAFNSIQYPVCPFRISRYREQRPNWVPNLPIIIVLCSLM